MNFFTTVYTTAIYLLNIFQWKTVQEVLFAGLFFIFIAMERRVVYRRHKYLASCAGQQNIPSDLADSQISPRVIFQRRICGYASELGYFCPTSCRLHHTSPVTWCYIQFLITCDRIPSTLCERLSRHNWILLENQKKNLKNSRLSLITCCNCFFYFIFT